MERASSADFPLQYDTVGIHLETMPEQIPKIHCLLSGCMLAHAYKYHDAVPVGGVDKSVNIPLPCRP